MDIEIVQWTGRLTRGSYKKALHLEIKEKIESNHTLTENALYYGLCFIKYFILYLCYIPHNLLVLFTHYVRFTLHTSNYSSHFIVESNQLMGISRQ